MDGKQTIKHALYHELLGMVSAVVGLGIVGLGVFLGFWESIDIMMNRAPADWGDAVAAAQPVVFLVVVVIGVIIWQFGKAVTAVKTAERVASQTAGGESVGGGADVEQVKSEVLSGVDDRLSDIESVVQENRQHVEEASATAEAAKATAESAAASGTDGAESATDSAGDRAADATEDTADAGSDATSGGSSRRSSRRSGSSGGSSSGGSGADADGDSDGTGESDREAGSNRRSNRRSARSSRDDDE